MCEIKSTLSSLENSFASFNQEKLLSCAIFASLRKFFRWCPTLSKVSDSSLQAVGKDATSGGESDSKSFLICSGRRVSQWFDVK